MFDKILYGDKSFCLQTVGQETHLFSDFLISQICSLGNNERFEWWLTVKSYCLTLSKILWLFQTKGLKG